MGRAACTEISAVNLAGPDAESGNPGLGLAFGLLATSVAAAFFVSAANNDIAICRQLERAAAERAPAP